MQIVTSYYLLLLILLLLSGAEVARSCLLCFTTPAERDSICKHAVLLDKMEHDECLSRLHVGFTPLNTISIAFPQIDDIRKYIKTLESEVKKIDKSFFPPSWALQFDYKIAAIVKGVKDRVASHPPAECRPPCGLQKLARSFTCSRCAVEECNVPVACPLETIDAEELDQTNIPCAASFMLPEQLKVVWKYAKKIRATDLSYFKDIHTGEDLFVLIKPTRVRHTGTYACEIIDGDNDIILRKFYYLNVIPAKTGNEMDIHFQRALVEKLQSQVEEEKKITEHGPSIVETILEMLQSNIAYAVYAGIALLFITLLVGFLWRYALGVDWSRERLYSPV